MGFFQLFPAATPPSALLLLLLPRIPSLPSGGSWRLRTVQHLLGRVWGKAVSRLVPKQRLHHRCQLGASSLRKVSTSWASATTGFLGASQAMMGGCVWCVDLGGGEGRVGFYPRGGMRWVEGGSGVFSKTALVSSAGAVVRTRARSSSGVVGCGSWFRARAGRERERERAKRERSRARQKGARGGGVIGRHDNSRNQHFGWG